MMMMMMMIYTRVKPLTEARHWWPLSTTTQVAQRSESLNRETQQRDGALLAYYPTGISHFAACVLYFEFYILLFAFCTLVCILHSIFVVSVFYFSVCVMYFAFPILFCVFNFAFLEQCTAEVEFVHAVTAGGSVKFLPAV